MDDFGIYAVFGTKSPPQRLLSAEGSCRASIAVPPSARQVVLFSSGPWGERICGNAELNNAEQIPITIGKLTPYNKCLSWEQWEEETWTDGVTLNVTLEGGNLATIAPLTARELNGKRKRMSEEEEDDARNKVENCQDEENLCPNKTSVREGRGQKKGGQKLLSSVGNVTKGQDTEAQAMVEKGSSQSIVKKKGRPSKTPKQSTPLLGPSRRWGQTLCPIDAQTAILIGGQGARMQFCKDPIWKLCTEDLSWLAAETLAEGPTPEGRIGHTSVYDPDSQRIFVFGGSKNRKWFNDVHILDTRSWKWTMVEAQGKVPPLSYHSCSLFRGELFVLGGVFPRPNPEPDGCSGSLHIFDPHLSIWYQPIVTGKSPSPRSGHSACMMQERKIYVFGGWDTPVCYNDMYMLDLGLMEFSAVKTTGKAPSPRSWHGSAVLSDTKFLIHGGYNGNKALCDAFIFDIDTNTWTEVKMPQFSLPRAGHSIITMAMPVSQQFTAEEEDGGSGSFCKTLLMFGGGDNEGSFFSDLTTIAVEEILSHV
ncbi:kelch repeat-containing protein [Takifugu flavidus]|uniref:RING finger protein B n=1 Tax=Takifugu flavidus TaxID=433684 RepID=A0A5C6N8W7_9TELE|nr:kelch repeat-containing protein [Takifugu flavidus]TWW63359.1 RING finger protein B [Takifugu flavidus]